MSSPSPAASPTDGYRLNHFMLRISNPTRTLHFYQTLMGMKSVFTIDVGPMTVYYLGYPSTPEHRADASKYAADTSRHEVLASTLGLVEFVHFHTRAEDTGGAEGSGQVGICSGSGADGRLGFNHLGFTVPDVGAAVKRLRAAGVSVVKDVGEGPNAEVPITAWERENGASEKEVSEGFGRIFRQLGFVRDPVSKLLAGEWTW